MIKFENKLELRYSFNDKSSYMDAMIKHRCEKEILSMIRVLADMLDVKMTAHCEPVPLAGGYRIVWPIAGESPRAISIVLNILMQVLSRPTLSVGGQPIADRTNADEEKMQKEILLLKRSLKLKDPGAQGDKNNCTRTECKQR